MVSNLGEEAHATTGQLRLLKNSSGRVKIPKTIPQGLKPHPFNAVIGTSKLVP
jgi:hypothetical protein